MELKASLKSLLAELRKDMLGTFKRHVATGDLLTDRWETARELGFGEGTSCYDNVLVMGDVRVGKNCWIGPNVVLDGSGGLSIGDWVDISAGAQIYSHDTVARALSGGKEPIAHARTTIGSRVYIGPQAIIAKGVTIGDEVTIGALSFVDRDVPSGSKVLGRQAGPA